MRDILQLIAEADIILATGHLSPAEVAALVDAARAHGVKKILIQHADMGIAKIPPAMQQELAQKGAFIEKCYLACSVDFNDLTVAQMAQSVSRLGAESCVMVTDYGQAHNVPPVQALSQFVEDMLQQGIREPEITKMVSENPRQLLGL